MKKAADKPYSALTDNLSTDECKIISDEEKRKILYDFNNIDVEYGKDKTIQELFENQVEKTPNNIALVFKDKQMTYKELNEKANSLARVLRKSGVDKEKIVGILVQKSTKMIIAMLGVLKAGGAYLPIDPDYPIDRIEYMLQDSGASVLLTQGKKYEIKGYNGETIDLQSSNLFEENKENLPIASKATNLAYIIYTSGTTGKPKGVMISHLGVSNLKVLFKNEMQICEGDRILQFASFSFDASVWEITMALLNGAQLNIPQKETTMNYIKFQDYLNSNKITVATLPPAYLNSLDSTEVKTLRLLITAGSSIDKKLLNKWSNKVKYINAYGPTEVTICSSIWHYNDNVAKLDAVPIGKPINNLRTYIVDENNNLAPIGVEGEICVSGDSLARGYLNREEITKERFVEDPFRPGNTMYKTGDFGRWLKDGNIEYLGRIDSQVKIRGFRIELGEIQNLLNQCNEVKESVVLARQDSSRELKLVAYIVVNDDKCTKNEDMQKQQISEWKSSYTGKNIKNEEMQEWIKFTIDRILSLKPNSLLEIGCGSGMLIFGIADKFKKYHGTDISNKAIEYVRNVIGKKENIKDKVTLIRSSAEDFSKIKENDFDTVIINSVIQYFPNIHYLINVIKDSISKINGRGVIFLGDIRNYSLLKAFYTSISIYQLSNDTQIDLLKNRIVKSVLNEKELTINPMFFYALKQSLSQITHVEIRYKRGNSHNELTKFRYDAILHINSEIDPVIKDEVDTAIDWSSNRLSVDAINNILVEEKPKILKVKNVPNARLAEVLKQEKILANGKYFKNIGELNKAVNNELYNNGVEPEEFFKINNEDYITEVIWAGDGNDRYYNVIFMDKAMYTKENNYALPSWQDSNTLSCDWGKYCNNPVKGKLEKKLLLKIKSYLKSKLPAYMLPSSYIRVEKMPLTLNGKIDIKALSKIDDTNVMQQEYEAPRNETEKNLVNIWEKVLERKTIGINEDFFDLGGHSLKALIAISEMKMKLEIDIDVGDIFNNPTIKMLSKLVEKLDKKQYIKIKKAEEKKYYKASSAEKRIYTLWEINKNSVEYNIPMIVEIKEKMDKDKVEEVLNSLISRHEALRTSFEIIDGEILQKVLKQWKLDFKYKELYKKDIKKEIGDFIKPFSLAKAPLLRSELIKTEENNYIFLLDFHHIIFDGVSNVVIMDEFKRLYRGDKLGEVEFQYKDYSEWQNGLEEKEKVKDQEAYWVNRFKGEIPILNLITDYERPIIRKLEGNKISFTVSEKLTSKINYMARETGTTLYMVLLSALNILLSKYSSQEDIIVGTAEAGRAKAEFRNVVGMFVNTVALRNYPNGNKTYRKFLEEVKKNTINDLKNSEYQFEDLIGKLNIERDVSRNPLFDVMFTVENMSINNENDVIELKSNLVKFDLSLIVVEKEDTINFDLEYSTSLFKKETIERMINHYKNILKIITTNADIKISEIEVLTVEENNRILYQFNNTKEEYSKGKNINELFEEQVERTPNNIAVVFGNEQLTYKELNERANSLARVLKEKGVVRETIVGIMVEGSLEMIVGIMGILKVGGSYLPIDSEYPDNRIEYMLENSKANIILTQSKFIGRINHGCEIINLENNLLYERDKSNLKIVSRPENLAYVIYTSGSTGKPKGVMVENKSLVNLCFWHNTCFNVTQNDKVTKYAGFGFDASVWEILPYIIKGAAIFLIPNEIRLNVMKLNEFYNKNNITISFLPTQLCEQFMRLKNNSLRILLTGADKLNTYKKQSYKLVNNYGPTEGTVVTTSFVVTKQCNNIPIGKPISNVKCYIVNSNNQLVPIGVAGELCIGGESLARGYLNNEKSTVESFVDNPFYIGTKMYRTGDLARWLPDGNIEYLGRMDNQIKIRGYRIEVGEIERNLLDQKEIIEAVVTSRNDKNNNKYICAYVTTNSEITTKKLKEKLSKKLPIYMIPNYIIQLDKMPITQNGKVDQKVLASIDITQELETKYEAPRNKTEEILVKVWEDVLCIDHIGIDHNYYELGGDSIKSILIVSKLQKYGMSLEIKDIMQYPEIKQLSNHVKNNDLQIVQEAVKGEVGLSPIQKWFFEENFLNKDHFNQEFMFYKKDGIDEKILGKAVEEILKHHDALRMIYKNTDNGFKQENRGIESLKDAFELQAYNLKEDEDYKKTIEKAANDIQRGMNIENGVLLRLGLFKTKAGDYLLIVAHHLVIDGVSWRILHEDLEEAYRSIENGEEVSFSRKTSSYKKWVEKLKEYANSKEFISEGKYWKAVQAEEVRKLPKDYKNNNGTFGQGEDITAKFTKEETERLIRKTNKAYRTEINDILLCALALAIEKWCEKGKVLINLEGHGRESILEDISIERTIGWFTSMYPVIIDVKHSDDIGYSIKCVKETLRHIPNKGVGYGIIKYLTEPQNKDNICFNVKPEIGFNYLGEFTNNPEGKLFKYSDLSGGESISRLNNRIESISINGLIVNGKLELVFNYSKGQYRFESIKKLSQLYIEKLLEIINHCESKKESEKTPSDYGDSELSIEDLEKILLRKRDIEKIHSLTPMQEGMLYNLISDKDSHAYFEQFDFKIEGNLNLYILTEVLNKIIEKHEILRTVFFYEGISKLKQAVLRKRETKIQYEDIRDLDEKNKKDYIEEFKNEDKDRGFDLENDCLIRVSAIRTGENKCRLVVSFHHIIMDGWSVGIVMKEMVEMYKALGDGKKIVMGETQAYNDYLLWLDKCNKSEALEYWKSYLNGYEKTVGFPQLSAHREGFEYKKSIKKVDEKLTSRLKNIAEKNNLTLNAIIQAAWGVLLQKYNNVDDVVFGTVISGRQVKVQNIENMVGLFINTVPLRVKSEGTSEFIELAKQVNADFISANAFYGYSSLAEVQALTKLRNNLINHKVVYENYPIDEKLLNFGEMDNSKEQIKSMEVFEQTNYDFGVAVMPYDSLDIEITYNGNKFDKEIIDSIQRNLICILENIALKPDIKVFEMEIVNSSEKNMLLEKFSRSKSEIVVYKTVQVLFEEQVRKTPDDVAVVFEYRKYTYRELNERANKLARVLIEKGITKNSIVALILEPSENIIISIISILKTGSAFLPIDEEFSKERIKNILEDSKVDFVVSNPGLIDNLGLKYNYLNIEDEHLYDGKEASNLNIKYELEDNVYVIYTSGTTGKPKGVVIQNNALVNYILSINEKMKLNNKSKALLSSKYCFDLGYTVLFPTITSGGELHIVSKETYINSRKLINYVKKSHINYLKITPTLFSIMVDNCDELKKCVDLKLIILGGENLNIGDVNKVAKECNWIRFINHYGPTEATIGCITNEIDLKKIKDEKAYSVIGRPINNVKIYILNSANKLMPVGVPGELCISGMGLGREYINNNELTRKKFVDNPFCIGTKMYKTGDLARWLPDGNIEHMGRIDTQVKIRGFRIETSEIESQLLKQGGIKEAAVVVKQDRNIGKYLCAYITADKKVLISELREQLSKELAYYMMPSYIIQIDKMTLTANGKLNRKILVELELNKELETIYMAPRNNLEVLLVSIWEKVLHQKSIGIDDNFFELGGHSLKAVEITSIIREELEVEVPVKEVLNNLTIKLLSTFIEGLNKKRYVKIQRTERRKHYSASSAEKRLYAIWEMEKDSISYNIPVILKINDEVNERFLEEILNKIIQRHEALRTKFEVLDGNLVQIVEDKWNLVFKYKELDEKMVENEIKGFNKPFDLRKAPLVRGELVKYGYKKYILILNIHHIVLDGVSISIIIKEFKKLYNNEKLQESIFQYRDYSDWQNTLQKSGLIKSQEAYWLDRFKGELPILNIQTDYERPRIKSFEGKTINFVLSREVTERSKKVAKQEGVTLYMLLLTVFNVMLWRYSRQEDIIVGTVEAGRNHLEFKDTIGMFVNTIALRNYPKATETFKEFLNEVKNNTLEDFQNADYQFEKLVNKLSIKRDTSRNPLFDIMFIFENIDYCTDDEDTKKIKPIETEINISKFDLTLIAKDENGKLNIALEYCSKLFTEDTIRRIGKHYENILNCITNNLDIKLFEIDVMDVVERNKLLNKFNNTKREYPCDKTIQELFEQQAMKVPNNIAVEFGEKKLTYRELNEKANSFARILRYKGLKEENIVAIMSERSIEMIIAILAVLKAGGAYLPIDPEYPIDRIKYMLDNSKAHILIKQGTLRKNIKYNLETFELEDTKLYEGHKGALNKVNGPNNLAYVIYTSGTTGKPKGVMITQRGLVNYIYWAKNKYVRNERTDFPLYSSISFDLTVTSIYTPLISGNKIIIYEGEDKALLVRKIVEDNKANIVKLTPTHLRLLEDMNLKKSQITKLIVGGEELREKVARNIYNAFDKDIEIYNEYGPTEATVGCMIYKYNPRNSNKTAVSIGVPANNTKLFILGENKELLPIGVSGELCIGGDGLARGYLNNEKLTAEKFIDNPFVRGEKIYRTGDLARWLSDGNMEYLGRIDKQVKVRGHRIETSEIENQLLKQNEIEEAVVITRSDKNDNKYICAYITAYSEVAVTKVEEELSKKLPLYMMPNYIMQLDKIPITQNGKVDQKVLAAIDITQKLETKYEAPRNETEEILVKVWEDILCIDHIGIDHNYYELGGDSIKSILIVSKLQKYGMSLEIKDIMQYPEIKQLSNHVKNNDLEIEQEEVKGEVGLSPIQKWFFEENFLKKDHFNQEFMFYKKDGIDEKTLEKAVEEILKHHDALRMIYKNTNNGFKQINRGIESLKDAFELQAYNLKEDEDYKKTIEKAANDIQRGVNIENGVLLKLGLFKTKVGDYLLIVAHHLVIDGVSWRILHEDLEEAYRSIENGEEVSFSRKTSSYKKWVEKLKEYANSKKFISEGKYWKAVQAEEVRKLPKDYKNNNGTFGQGEDITAKFTKEETERLLRKTNKAYRTEINDILLCALALAVEKWAGNEKILINLEGHGREAILEDISIERTIGWFTSMYPVIIDVKHSGDIGYSIKYVKETLRHIPNKGVGYGIIKYLTEPQNKDNICFNVKPEIGFNYLGEFTNNPEGGSFEYSDLSGGESISKLNNKIESISINGLIVNGKLELVFNYSTGQYKYESIKKLSQLYIEKLLEIINHCESKKESEKTPSDYGDSELSIEDLEKILLRKKDIEKIHSLTPMQEGMLYNLISDKDSHAYFEQFDFKIEGNLNLYILTEVLNKIIEKHEILRTAFFYEGISKLKQAVLRKREIEIQYEDIRNLDEEGKKAYIEEFKNEDKNRGFDLGNDCLIRVSAIRTGENRCRLVCSFHHIIMDGWSVGIVMKEIVDMYKALAEGKKIVIEEAQSYNDYLLWLDKCNKSEALEYWKSYLNGYEQEVEFPKLNTKETKFKYVRTIKKTDKNLGAKLKNIAEKNNLTLNAIIQAAWGVLLQKYNNADDVVFGTVISGRQVKVQNIENMVGLFINTVPLRVKSEVDTKFIELAKKVNTDFIQSNASYAYASLAEVQAFTNMRNKLINHTVIYENYPIDEKLLSLDKEGDSDLRIKEEDVFEQTDYNLEVLIVPGEEITVKIIYNNSIFLENTINEIFESLFTIIKHVSNNPNIELSKIDMISGEEREMLLYTFNNTDKDYMKAKTIQELFEEQVERTPNAIALEFNGSKLTYFELEKRSNKVARYLINKGIKNNNIIPIIVKKSFELISGIIGILKSGGCYLPIDSDYPMDRINYMLDDSKAKIVLTESDLKSKIDFSGNIVDIRSEDIAGQSDSRLNNINISSDLAYVIYTSGSTGKSKGVAIEHRSVNNFIDGINSKIKIQDDDVIVSVTTCSFDIFGLESIFSLSKGLKVVIAGLKEQMDPKLLNELIIKTDVNVIQTTPSRIKLMLSADNAKNSFKKLKVMMIGGEVFPKDLLFEIRKLTKARIYNMYGPTETTIWSSIKDLTEENDVNVGKPISNTQMYILDKNDNLIPNGNAGELCIAGDGLSRGYLNMEELTKSKFVDNPFSKGKRMYKTGDLARWLPNGDIELIGRLDNQVKINGYRIELGEVQSVANKHEKIKECIAVGIKNGIGSQDLALYYVANGNITITEVVRYLSNKLPYYMVPKRFVEIEKIPLTNNGKVNLKDLPEPINNRKDVGNYYQDADTDTQKNISSIWCKLLEMNNVGIYDNFFEVGGNSIKIVAMYNEIKKIYPNKIEITDIFSHPTIYSLAKRIDNKEKTKKKLDKHVKSIQFPADYIVKGNEHNADSTFRFKFKDKMFEKIVQMKQGGNYEITHILMASYVFLISEICKESVFSIQASISEDDIVSELKFNLLGMKNFYDIAKNVKDNLNNFNNEIMYDTYKSNIIVDRTNENSIVAMFTEVTQSKFNYLTLYDLIFEVHKGNSEIDIVCKYNSKKLKQSKIQQLFYNYIKLIKSIIGNDSV